MKNKKKVLLLVLSLFLVIIVTFGINYRRTRYFKDLFQDAQYIGIIIMEAPNDSHSRYIPHQYELSKDDENYSKFIELLSSYTYNKTILGNLTKEKYLTGYTDSISIKNLSQTHPISLTLQANGSSKLDGKVIKIDHKDELIKAIETLLYETTPMLEVQ